MLLIKTYINGLNLKAEVQKKNESDLDGTTIQNMCLACYHGLRNTFLSENLLRQQRRQQNKG